MIKPVNISPTDDTNKVYVECPECSFKTTLAWNNKTINTDNDLEMQDLLFEECPECCSVLTSKDEFKRILLNKIEESVIIINYLMRDNTLDTDLLKEYQKIFTTYNETKDIERLRSLSNLFHRSSDEAERTDFTTATSVEINGRYVNLAENILFIEKIIARV